MVATMPSKVIGAKKSIFSFTLIIGKIFSYFQWGKPIENSTIIWTSDIQDIKEMRKDSNAIRPHNQREHGTGAGGG